MSIVKISFIYLLSLRLLSKQHSFSTVVNVLLIMNTSFTISANFSGKQALLNLDPMILMVQYSEVKCGTLAMSGKTDAGRPRFRTQN